VRKKFWAIADPGHDGGVRRIGRVDQGDRVSRRSSTRYSSYLYELSHANPWHLRVLYHDSAAALVEDGRIVAAAQEEPLHPQEA